MNKISLFKKNLCEWYTLNSIQIMSDTLTDNDRAILLTERTAYAEAFHAAMEALSNEHVHK